MIDDSAVISHLQEGLPDYKSSEEGDEEGDGRDPPVVFSPIQECMYAEELPPSRLQRIQEVLDHDTFRVEPSQVSNGQVGRSGPLPVLLPPTNSGFFSVPSSFVCAAITNMFIWLAYVAVPHSPPQPLLLVAPDLAACHTLLNQNSHFLFHVQFLSFVFEDLPCLCA